MTVAYGDTQDSDSSEIEVKILDIDPDIIRGRLSRAGATHQSTDDQVNQIFSTRGSSVQLRLRTVEDTTIFTVKVPVVADGFKVRKELETIVHDAEIFSHQLMWMGYTRVYLLEKRRETYLLRGSIVCLDHYPDIPWLIEIEGPVSEIEATVHDLGYTMADTVAWSFRQVLERYCPGKAELRFRR